MERREVNEISDFRIYVTQLKSPSAESEGYILAEE